MTSAEEINEVLVKAEATSKRLPTITVELTDREVDYLLLGLGELVPGAEAVAQSLQALRAKLFSALMEEKENG